MTAQCTSLGLKAFNILHNPPQPPPHITHHAIIHSLCIHWILLSMTSEILQKSWNSKNYRNRENNRTALLNMESESTIYIFQSILIKMNHDPVDYWIHQVSVFSCDAFLFLALFTSRYFFIFLFFLLQIFTLFTFSGVQNCAIPWSRATSDGLLGMCWERGEKWRERAINYS